MCRGSIRARCSGTWSHLRWQAVAAQTKSKKVQLMAHVSIVGFSHFQKDPPVQHQDKNGRCTQFLPQRKAKKLQRQTQRRLVPLWPVMESQTRRSAPHFFFKMLTVFKTTGFEQRAQNVMSSNVSKSICR